MLESKISKIKRLKIICKNCKTEIIADIGKKISNCPCCYNKFIQDDTDNPYYLLSETFTFLSQNNNAIFNLVFDDERDNHE